MREQSLPVRIASRSLRTGQQLQPFLRQQSAQISYDFSLHAHHVWYLPSKVRGCMFRTLVLPNVTLLHRMTNGSNQIDRDSSASKRAP